MQLCSQRQQSDDGTSRSSATRRSPLRSSNPLTDDRPLRGSPLRIPHGDDAPSHGVDNLLTEERPNRDTTTRAARIDSELQEAEQERDLLLKEQRLASIQREVQALRRRDATDPPVGNLLIPDNEEEEEEDGSLSRTSRTTRSSKRHAEEALDATIIKRNIRPERLSTYAGKSVRDHLNFVRSAETAFRLTPENFPTDEAKILYAMQYLVGEPRDAWYRHQEVVPIETLQWEYFTDYLLNLVEDPVNRQLHSAQSYSEAIQRPGQSVQAFAAYLSTLEAQLPPYKEEQLVMHFFTKLRPEVRKALSNYQNLPDKRDSLVALAARLESNLREPGGATSRRGQTDTRPVRGAAPVNRKVVEHTTLTRTENVPARSNTFTSKMKARSDVTCYRCQGKGHYSNECTRPPSNPNHIRVSAAGQSKKESASSKPQRRRNNGQK